MKSPATENLSCLSLQERLGWLLAHLEASYLKFMNDDSMGYKTFYNKACENFNVTVNEFFEYLDAQEELSDEGLCILADLFDAGIGVSKNKKKARSLYKTAAEENYPPALYGLACLSSKEKACFLLLRAAQADFRLAVYELARHYKYGWIVQPDYVQSLKLFMKAKEMGDLDAEAAIQRLIKHVLTLKDYIPIKVFEFLIAAKIHGFDVEQDLQLLLNKIGKNFNSDCIYKCYIAATAVGIACPSEMRDKANVVSEEQMNVLRVQAVKSLGASISKITEQKGSELTQIGR